jgi:hypothetical protein
MTRSLKDLEPIPQRLLTNKSVKSFACRVGNSVADCKTRAELICEKGATGTIFAGRNQDNMRIYAFVIGDVMRFKQKNTTFKWSKIEDYTITTTEPKETPLVMAKF